MRSLETKWFLGFTAVFAALMAYVFWGTWATDVAPVMPDDTVRHSLEFSRQFSGWFRGWLDSGKFVPSDLFFQPIIVSRYVTQEFKYAASGYFAALALAYFLRGYGLSRLASYGAGLLLGFSGYWFSLFSAGHAGWFVWMNYGVFAFAFADRAVRENRLKYWALLGATLAWGSFCQPDLWLLFSVFTAVYFVFVCIRERKLPWKGSLIALLFFVAIGLPSFRDAFGNALSSRDEQIAETVERRSDGTVDPESAARARWIFATNWSLPPEESLEFVWPRINGDTSCPMTLGFGQRAGSDVKPYTGRLGRPFGADRGNYRQHSLYVGFVTCLLALAGILAVFRRKDPRVWFFFVAALVFWLCSLGRFCEGFYRIVYMLPFGDYLRAPVKWHHLTELCLAVLAGFGIEAFSGFFTKKLGGVVSGVVVGAVVLVGAANLAYVDGLYCAPIDLTMVKGVNAAADAVKANGGGKVADLIERGNGFISWSFGAHDVATVADPNERGVRFVWVGLKQVNDDRRLSEFLKARSVQVGRYNVTSQGIGSAGNGSANAALYRIKDAPDYVTPPRDRKCFVISAGIVSFLATLCAFVLMFVPRKNKLS